MKSVFILVDRKLNAIIGVFSSQQTVDSAKKSLIKRDLLFIKDKILNDLVMITSPEDRLRYNIKTLKNIEFVLKNDNCDEVIIEYDGTTPCLRYVWYKFGIDSFDVDKLFLSPIAIISNGKDDFKENYLD